MGPLACSRISGAAGVPGVPYVEPSCRQPLVRLRLRLCRPSAGWHGFQKRVLAVLIFATWRYRLAHATKHSSFERPGGQCLLDGCATSLHLSGCRALSRKGLSGRGSVGLWASGTLRPEAAALLAAAAAALRALRDVRFSRVQHVKVQAARQSRTKALKHVDKFLSRCLR